MFSFWNYSHDSEEASLVAQTVKSLPVMWETRIWSLSQEHPLEKEMATHSSILAWIIPWTEEPGGLESTGSWRVGHDWATNTHTLPWIYSLPLLKAYLPGHFLKDSMMVPDQIKFPSLNTLKAVILFLHSPYSTYRYWRVPRIKHNSKGNGGGVPTL